MRFARLRLQNWKNFRSVDVPLEPRMFLVGPNASGKSNLLDVFRFLRDIAKPKGGGLQWAVEDQRFGMSQVRSLHARQKSDVVVEVEVDDPGVEAWTYHLELEGDKLGTKVKREVVQRGGEIVLDRPNAEDKADAERLRETHLEQVSANKSFRALAEFFAAVDYLHLVPQLLRQPDRFEAIGSDPLGSDLMVRMASVPAKRRDARLKKIRKAMQVAVPRLNDLKFERDKAVRPHLLGQFEHWRPNAGWHHERQFSDGTLRLIALLWALSDGHEPLLLEEPELSLNPSIVREIPRMLHRMRGKSGRQVLVSTHSADLLSDPGISLAEILLVVPGKDGPEVRVAADMEECRALLEAGLEPGAAVMPQVAPGDLEQLSFGWN